MSLKSILKAGQFGAALRDMISRHVSLANRLPGMVAVGEESIDKTTNPLAWQQVVKKRGTSTVLVRNNLYESDGTTPITTAAQIVGARLAT